MATGWERLGAALAAGSPGAREARRDEMLGDLLVRGRQGEALKQDIMKTGGLEGLGDALVGMGFDPSHASGLAAIGRAGLNPEQYTGARGDLQGQGYRQAMVDAGLGGDIVRAGAYSLGLADKPLEMTKITDGTAYNPYAAPGLGDMLTTDVGQSTIRQRNAAAGASNAQAQAALGRLGIAQAQAAKEHAGLWNPSGKPAGGASGAGSAKPIPVGALSKLLEVEDALGGTEVMSGIIQKHAGRLKDGSLQLSPLNSLTASGRTAAGFATPNDVAINEWNADKTKIVNESLRLNKGVQTEGDAQRAANELMAANDPATAARALQRLTEINNQAVQLQRRKQDLINSNYGRGPNSQGLGDQLAPQPGGWGIQKVD